MDEFTQLIKKNIKHKYSSTRRFADELGIPQTTIVSAIKNGISGTSFTTVCKICKALDIKLVDGVYPVVATDNARAVLEKLASLDERGIHTVSTVLEVEYVRCNKDRLTDESEITEYEKSGYIVEKNDIPSKKELTELLKVID